MEMDIDQPGDLRTLILPPILYEATKQGPLQLAGAALVYRKEELYISGRNGKWYNGFDESSPSARPWNNNVSSDTFGSLPLRYLDVTRSMRDVFANSGPPPPATTQPRTTGPSPGTASRSPLKSPRVNSIIDSTSQAQATGTSEGSTIMVDIPNPCADNASKTTGQLWNTGESPEFISRVRSIAAASTGPVRPIVHYPLDTSLQIRPNIFGTIPVTRPDSVQSGAEDVMLKTPQPREDHVTISRDEFETLQDRLRMLEFRQRRDWVQPYEEDHSQRQADRATNGNTRHNDTRAHDNSTKSSSLPTRHGSSRHDFAAQQQRLGRYESASARRGSSTRYNMSPEHLSPQSQQSQHRNRSIMRNTGSISDGYDRCSTSPRHVPRQRQHRNDYPTMWDDDPLSDDYPWSHLDPRTQDSHQGQHSSNNEAHRSHYRQPSVETVPDSPTTEQRGGTASRSSYTQATQSRQDVSSQYCRKALGCDQYWRNLVEGPPFGSSEAHRHSQFSSLAVSRSSTPPSNTIPLSPFAPLFPTPPPTPQPQPQPPPNSQPQSYTQPQSQDSRHSSQHEPSLTRTIPQNWEYEKYFSSSGSSSTGTRYPVSTETESIRPEPLRIWRERSPLSSSEPA